jgi:hypothetical protein
VRIQLTGGLGSHQLPLAFHHPSTHRITTVTIHLIRSGFRVVRSTMQQHTHPSSLAGRLAHAMEAGEACAFAFSYRHEK